jgi:hypothetical protein
MPHRLAAALRAAERIALRELRRAYPGLPSRATRSADLACSGWAAARDRCSRVCALERY